MIACWLHAHGVPVRFVAISTAQNCELCHVFAHAWGMDLDATYNEYHGMLGKYPYNKDVTARADLTGDF
ncbi:MAG: hypothetical protein IKC13_01560 [Elusimicrobiaceae bacterium]|nr:hypothetical protein [Elusimicrobiaceae bacterium]